MARRLLQRFTWTTCRHCWRRTGSSSADDGRVEKDGKHIMDLCRTHARSASCRTSQPLLCLSFDRNPAWDFSEWRNQFHGRTAGPASRCCSTAAKVVRHAVRSASTEARRRNGTRRRRARVSAQDSISAWAGTQQHGDARGQEDVMRFAPPSCEKLALEQWLARAFVAF